MTPREYETYATQRKECLKETNKKENYRQAVLLAHITNMFGGKKSKRYKPEDFLKTKREKTGTTQSPQLMAEILKAFTIAVGGDIK